MSRTTWNPRRFSSLRPAASEAGVDLSYGQLDEHANRVATGLLKMGVRPGERIGICAPNSTDWIMFYFGVLKAGAIAITLSSVSKKDELTSIAGPLKTEVSFHLG